MIDYTVFYAVSAIFRPYNGATVNKRWSFVKFWSFPGGPHEPTLHRNQVKRSFACQGGCYPWHGAPFNIPSDGHSLENIYILGYLWIGYLNANSIKCYELLHFHYALKNQLHADELYYVGFFTVWKNFCQFR